MVQQLLCGAVFSSFVLLTLSSSASAEYETGSGFDVVQAEGVDGTTSSERTDAVRPEQESHQLSPTERSSLVQEVLSRAIELGHDDFAVRQAAEGRLTEIILDDATFEQAYVVLSGILSVLPAVSTFSGYDAELRRNLETVLTRNSANMDLFEIMADALYSSWTGGSQLDAMSGGATIVRALQAARDLLTPECPYSFELTSAEMSAPEEEDQELCRSFLKNGLSKVGELNCGPIQTVLPALATSESKAVCSFRGLENVRYNVTAKCFHGIISYSVDQLMREPMIASRRVQTVLGWKPIHRYSQKACWLLRKPQDEGGVFTCRRFGSDDIWDLYNALRGEKPLPQILEQQFSTDDFDGRIYESVVPLLLQRMKNAPSNCELTQERQESGKTVRTARTVSVFRCFNSSGNLKLEIEFE